jgi:hypothetical protein
MTVATYRAGATAPLQFQFFNDDTGILTDVAALQADITYGSATPVPGDSSHDVVGGGPFTYQGAGVPTPGQIWRLTTGVYQLDWPIPYAVDSGVYVANWAATFGSDLIGAVEDFNVNGAYGLGRAAPILADVGPWQDSLVAPDGTTIRFGALDTDPGTAGVAWMRDSLTGVGGPDTSGQVVQRANDHGGWATPQFYAPVIYTLACHASAPTQALRDAARAKLQRAVVVGGAAGDMATLYFDEPIPKQSLVRRSGKIIETYPNLSEAVFSIGLIAPDPRRYAVALRSATVQAAVTLNGITPPLTPPITMPANGLPAVIAATNNGNFETRPRIIVDGPIQAPALTLVDTGQTVSFSGVTLATGQQIIVDFDLRQATINGALTPADITSGWWVLAPGTSTVRLGGIASSGAAMTLQWRDAYI